MMAEARRQNQKLVNLFNDRKFEEIGDLDTDDGILIAPNTEPVQGRPAIVEWFRTARDIHGEVELLPDTFRTSASGSFVSLVEKFSAYLRPRPRDRSWAVEVSARRIPQVRGGHVRDERSREVELSVAFPRHRRGAIATSAPAPAT